MYVLKHLNDLTMLIYKQIDHNNCVINLFDLMSIPDLPILKDSVFYLTLYDMANFLWLL